MTKKQKQIIENHSKSNLRWLSQCYTKYSVSKECAYNKCLSTYNKLGGRDFKIISYNLNVFTIGFYYVKDSKKMFHYETNVTVLDFIVD